MEPIVALLIPAVLGGLVMALLLLLTPARRKRDDAQVVVDSSPLGIDAINMAHIRVDGIGGLGLVAMAFGVAVAVPRIGETVTLGLVLGLGLAATWILRRRSTGALPTSGKHPGAHSLFAIPGGEAENNSQHERYEVKDLTAVPVP